MRLGVVQQQPAERLSYTISYKDALTTADNVESAIAEVDPEGSLVVDALVVNDPEVRIWVSGGVHNARYKVSVTTTTADGRIFQDELVFAIREI